MKKLLLGISIIIGIVLIFILGCKLYLLNTEKEYFEKIDINKSYSIKEEKLFDINISNVEDNTKEYYGIINDEYFFASTYLPSVLNKNKTHSGNIEYSNKKETSSITFSIDHSILSTFVDLVDVASSSSKYINNYSKITNELPNIKNDSELLQNFKKNNFKVNMNIFVPFIDVYDFYRETMPILESSLETYYKNIYLYKNTIISINKNNNKYIISIPIDEVYNYYIEINNKDGIISNDDIQKLLNSIVIIKK